MRCALVTMRLSAAWRKISSDVRPAGHPRDDVGQYLPRPHRGQLIDIADKQQCRPGRQGAEHRAHQRHVDHRGFIDDQQVASWSVRSTRPAMPSATERVLVTGGSIIVIIATDALAFATAEAVRRTPARRSAATTIEDLPQTTRSPRSSRPSPRRRRRRSTTRCSRPPRRPASMTTASRRSLLTGSRKFSLGTASVRRRSDGTPDGGRPLTAYPPGQRRGALRRQCRRAHRPDHPARLRRDRIIGPRAARADPDDTGIFPLLRSAVVRGPPD
jgi:hypothetical protein